MPGIRIPNESARFDGSARPDGSAKSNGLKKPGGLAGSGKLAKPESPVKARQNSQPAKPGVNARAGTGFQKNPPHIGGNSPGLPNRNLPNAPRIDLLTADSLAGKADNTPGGQNIQAWELFKHAIIALALPNDPLSMALLAFTRFFSLPPEPGQLGRVRREILSSGKRSDPVNAKEKASLEAEALARLAAADKGVALSSEALEYYSHFFSPPITGSPGDGKNNNPREKAPGPEELQAMAEGQTGNDDFLNMLNSLPGGNGQRWSILPFKINAGGIELALIIRILKREADSLGGADFIIADIAGQKWQWRCFLKRVGGKFLADIRVYPELTPRALKSLKREAARFIGKGYKGKAGNIMKNFPGFDEILVANGEEFPSWAEDLCNESLPSINKEV